MIVDATETPRQAAVLFVRDAITLGWGRRELAHWLVCHYGPSVRGGADAPRDETAPRPLHLHESTITELVSAARARAIALLEDLRDRDIADNVARTMIARGLVEGVRDEHGAIAYVPVHRPELRLAERVTSLFVADYLNVPFDYWRGSVSAECQSRRQSDIVALLDIDEEPPATLPMGITA